MTIKKILVPLFGRRPPDTLPLAIALAERFDAFVEVFHPRRDPRSDLAYLAPGAGGFGVGTGVATVLDAAEEDSRARENAARQVYAAAIEGASGRVRTGFVTAMGRETELLPARARVADLALLPRPSDDGRGTLEAGLEALLFESGRPVLLIPPEIREMRPETVAIAWNDSPESARAVSAALPFLERAQRVVALTVGDYGLADLTEHLGHHGIAAEPRPIEARSGGFLEDRTGELLLDACRREGVDLLVMGAYSHTRIRQIIVSGATRKVLSAAPIPVLMAH